MENDTKRLMDTLLKDETLATRVKEAWKANTGAAALVQVLREAGIEVDGAAVEVTIADLKACGGIDYCFLYCEPYINARDAKNTPAHTPGWN